MEHPVEVGDRTTLAVIAVLRELGSGVLMLFGENTRYDLVIDDGGALAKSTNPFCERIRNRARAPCTRPIQFSE